MIIVHDRFTGEPLSPVAVSTPEAIEATLAAAAKASHGWGRADRAPFLEACADALEARRAEIVAIAHRESGLPLARLEGELSRTTGQLRFFASILREGSWLDRREDVALPDRQPLPRPAITSLRRPLGPVLVFGASNFPLAFSTAGGDTASALAAGCPIVVKAHPAHPATAALVGEALAAALPEGVFGQIFEAGYEVGQQLAADPRIAAIGFTGSRRAGLALHQIAQSRPTPIPVFAEMSSVNPSVALPGAMTPAFAKGLVGSVTLGCGQFCTNPGLVFLVNPSSEFLATLTNEFDSLGDAPMLTDGIAKAYAAGLAQWEASGAAPLRGWAGGTEGRGGPAAFQVTSEAFRADPRFQEEVFGPAALFVRCTSVADALACLAILEGQLTASLHASPEEFGTAKTLLPHLEKLAGRILLNQFPTGVEVCDSMVHGGPWPATSAPSTTSVGGRALLRWTRPIAYQNIPPDWL